MSIFNDKNHLNFSKNDFNLKLDNQCRHTGHASRHLAKRFFLGPTDLVYNAQHGYIQEGLATHGVGPVPTNFVF